MTTYKIILHLDPIEVDFDDNLTESELKEQAEEQILELAGSNDGSEAIANATYEIIKHEHE